MSTTERVWCMLHSASRRVGSPCIRLAQTDSRQHPANLRGRDQACSIGGATLKTSARVLTPAATFIAPEMRKGFMPSRKASSRILAISLFSLMASLRPARA